MNNMSVPLMGQQQPSPQMLQNMNLPQMNVPPQQNQVANQQQVQQKDDNLSKAKNLIQPLRESLAVKQLVFLIIIFNLLIFHIILVNLSFSGSTVAAQQYDRRWNNVNISLIRKFEYVCLFFFGNTEKQSITTYQDLISTWKNFIRYVTKSSCIW